MPVGIDGAAELEFDARQHQRQQLGIGRLAQIVRVEVGELHRVEARRRAADARQVEPLDRLLGRDDLVVAMAPAQPQQVVAQRLGQEAHVAIGIDAERAVALAELGAVGPVDQRDMGIDRLGPAHRLDDLQLPEGVVEMVVAADHVRDAHVVVVDHDRVHVGRRAVGAQQDHVVELGVLDLDLALHGVLDHGLAVLRRLQPDHRRHARRRVLRIAIAPAAVIAHRHAGAALGVAHLLELLGRGVAVVGLALGQHLLGHLGVARRALELVDDVAVPIEAEPRQAVEDRLDGRGRRARAIGVLDAQQVLAAVMAGVQPVEERRARAADMQKAGGRGGEAGDDGHGLEGIVQGSRGFCRISAGKARRR